LSEIDFGVRRKGDDYVKYLEMKLQELEAEVNYLRNEVNYYKR
jgi:hypothetical protein